MFIDLDDSKLKNKRLAEKRHAVSHLLKTKQYF